MTSNNGRFASRLRAGLTRTRGWIVRHPWWTALLLPLLAIAYVLALIPFTPSIGDLRKAKQAQPSVVLTADGEELAVYKRANRDWVKLADIAPTTIRALLATEDRRFYEHPGIDIVRTAKAAVATATGDRQGGSTLTQQLARNLFPEEIGRAPTLTRKVKEAITALKIEAVYSKDEILETYLNSVPFLYNAFGIEAAARTYFDKPASQLNELESATLVGMLKGTSYYNPVLNPERALDRRNTVLALMVRNGELQQERYERLKAQPLKLDFERLPEVTGPAPHLAEFLRRWLIEWADRNDYDVYTDGLVVRTTLDSRLQKLANEAVTEQADMLQAVADVEWARSSLASHGIQPSAYVAQRGKVKPFDHFWSTRKDLVDAFIRETSQYKLAREQGQPDAEALQRLRADGEFMQQLREDKTRLQAGFLALEPQTGHVKAWVGSRGYAEDKFDHVQQARRQPGSTFKPFVYGAAFEQGIPPNQTLMDAPVAIQIDRRQVWRPTDVGAGPTNAPMTLREGLARSKNTISAQLMMQVGPPRVASLARAMGVRQSPLEAVPSLALGTSPVTLKEMVSAFGTIANGGSYIEPVIVTAIEDRTGRTLATFGGGASERAVSAATASTLVDVMRGVVDEGTAVGLRSRFGISGDVAGKTGTTQGNTDGWFILMHPQLVAGAWVGFNDNRVTMRSDYWGQGAHNALLVVGDFYQQAFKDKVLDAKATFAAPRMKDQEQPLVDRMNDWFNSVFQGAPQEPSATEVAATPPMLEPPALEPAPANAWPEATGSAGTPANAPVIVVDPRLPEFPRPLEIARPADTIPGTQVYRTPDVALGGPPAARPAEPMPRGSAEPAPARSRPEPVYVPRPWNGEARGSGRPVEERGTAAVAPAPAEAPPGAVAVEAPARTDRPAAASGSAMGGSPGAETFTAPVERSEPVNEREPASTLGAGGEAPGSAPTVREATGSATATIE